MRTSTGEARQRSVLSSLKWLAFSISFPCSLCWQKKCRVVSCVPCYIPNIFFLSIDLQSQRVTPSSSWEVSQYFVKRFCSLLQAWWSYSSTYFQGISLFCWEVTIIWHSSPFIIDRDINSYPWTSIIRITEYFSKPDNRLFDTLYLYIF